MDMLDRTIRPAIQPSEPYQIAKPVLRKLSNGIPMYVFHNEREDVVRLDIVIQSGQWQQNQFLQAIFTNRMLREGTSKYTSQQIAESLDFYGSWLDLSCAQNQSYITLYSLGKYFEQTLQTVQSMLLEATFPEKEFQTVVANNKQQYFINQTKMEVLARKELNKNAFGPGHPCGKFAEEADYEKITIEALKDYYTKFYHSGNVTLYVSGNASQHNLEFIENLLGANTWGQIAASKDNPIYIPKPTTLKRVVINKPEAVQSSLRMGFSTINRRHPDFQKFNILTTLFGGYFGSRLMSNIRENKGYTYSIFANIVNYPQNGLFLISTETANEYVQPIIDEIYKEIYLLQTVPVDKKELQMVKNYMMGEFCRTYEGFLSLSDAYMMLEASDLDYSFFEESVQSILEVTSAELMETAQKYLIKENIKEVIAGKQLNN